jgi:hypothetical protein
LSTGAATLVANITLGGSAIGAIDGAAFLPTCGDDTGAGYVRAPYPPHWVALRLSASAAFAEPFDSSRSHQGESHSSDIRTSRGDAERRLFSESGLNGSPCALARNSQLPAWSRFLNQKASVEMAVQPVQTAPRQLPVMDQPAPGR